MFYSRQVIIGRGQRDSDAFDRAVALELFAASIWDGRGQLVVNFPHSLRHQLHQSEVEEFSRECLTPIHAEVYRLRRGWDYDVRPLSASQCRRLGIGEEYTLSSGSGD